MKCSVYSIMVLNSIMGYLLMFSKDKFLGKGQFLVKVEPNKVKWVMKFIQKRCFIRPQI